MKIRSDDDIKSQTSEPTEVISKESVRFLLLNTLTANVENMVSSE